MLGNAQISGVSPDNKDVLSGWEGSKSFSPQPHIMPVPINPKPAYSSVNQPTQVHVSVMPFLAKWISLVSWP